MISPASFRLDLPAFSNATVYDDYAINYWIAVANLMMGVVTSAGGNVTTNGASAISSNVLNFASVPAWVIPGLSVTDPTNPAAIPLGATVQSVTATTVTITRTVAAPGVSNGDAITFGGSAPVARKWGVGSTAPLSPPTTLLDLGTELFVAHNLVLEKRSQDAAKNNGTPGQVVGPVTSKSVGGVSISYDAAASVEPDAGYWAQTTYGNRFLRLARQKGMGPVQIGIGWVPPYAAGVVGPYGYGFFGSFGAWPGPPLDGNF